MYEQFYGLTDKPFSLTPNPRFVYYSKQYREAESQLLYGISNREGFMLLTGQPGTGKTTLCRDLIEKLDRDKSQSALIFNPFLSGVEMLAALLTEFGIIVPPGATRKDLLDRLNQFLLAQLALGRSCVAIFDEAQHLSPEFLEQIRVLSNLETDQEKLIQIILAGQPELLDKIRTPMMAQLDQRVSIRCALADLDEEETDRYIHHRLNVAGARGQIRFAPKAVSEIYHASHGVPRLINLVADRALLAGYAAQTRDIQPEHVRKAVAALRGEDAEVDANVAAGPPRGMGSSAPPENQRKAARRAIWFAAAAGILAVAALATAAVTFWPRGTRKPADEELYWQATMSTSTADAERDLNSLIATYPTSRRVDDALLRLAELELARSDRTDAVAHLTDLARRAKTGLGRTRASLLASVARLDGGDTTAACANRPTAVDSADAVNPLVARDLQNITMLCTAHDSVLAAAAAAMTPADTAAGRGPAPAAARGAAPAAAVATRGRGAAATDTTARRPAAGRARGPATTAAPPRTPPP
ncbi:MAG TPA: AAA family ATPase [Gemmatimonadaceae bacterium]|jgi:type II secretory pathway predicted ATPase ExeA